MNSGFLAGPYVPVYGFGAVVILSIEPYLSQHINEIVRIALYTVLATIIEYYAGLTCEQVFGVRLWDYSRKPFNLHGRICLQFSIYWGVIIHVNLKVVFPVLTELVDTIPMPVLIGVNRFLLVAIMLDFTVASRNLSRIVRFFDMLNKDYFSITRERFLDTIHQFRRLLQTFPNLKTYVKSNIRSNILRDFKMNIQEILAKNLIRESSGNAIMNNGDTEAGFNDIVKDILSNQTFQKLKNFRHHDGSIYDHVKAVAYLTYRYCRKRKVDCVSATRGALLHDFFLYDWRTGLDENGKYNKGHIFLHARMAMENSDKEFTLNDMERDIILNHMWPLSPSIPKYRETFIVSIIDKYVSSREFINHIAGRKGNSPLSFQSDEHDVRNEGD